MKPFYFLTEFPIFRGLQILWRDKQKRQFPYKKTAYNTGRKNESFQILFCCTSSLRNNTFLFEPKFHIFNGSEISLGGKQKCLFSIFGSVKTAFMSLNEFFQKNNFCCTSSRLDETFLLITKISYLQRFKDFIEGQAKRPIAAQKNGVRYGQ